MKIITYNSKAVLLDSNKLLKSVVGGSFIVVSTNKYLATLTCGTQSYTCTGTETSHAFQVVSNATYTCTASKTGYQTKTGSVTVTTDNIYSLTLNIKRLPDEYQEVEYLQNSDEQYIDTGYAWTTGSIKYDFTWMSTTETKLKALIGSSNATSDSNWCVMYSSRDNSYYWAIGTGNVLNTSFLNLVKYHTEMSITGTTATQIVNNGAPVVETCSTEFYPYGSVYVYSMSYHPSSTWIAAGGVRFYSVKLTDNNVLVRNFIPCYRKSDSKPGMYDTVNDVFYTNANSSASTDFTVGPDVN